MKLQISPRILNETVTIGFYKELQIQQSNTTPVVLLKIVMKMVMTKEQMMRDNIISNVAHLLGMVHQPF